jgi:hypothetical protein
MAQIDAGMGRDVALRNDKEALRVAIIAGVSFVSSCCFPSFLSSPLSLSSTTDMLLIIKCTNTPKELPPQTDGSTITLPHLL